MSVTDDMFCPIKKYSLSELQVTIGEAISNLVKSEYDCKISKIYFEDSHNVNIEIKLNNFSSLLKEIDKEKQ